MCCWFNDATCASKSCSLMSEISGWLSCALCFSQSTDSLRVCSFAFSLNVLHFQINNVKKCLYISSAVLNVRNSVHYQWYFFEDRFDYFGDSAVKCWIAETKNKKVGTTVLNVRKGIHYQCYFVEECSDCFGDSVKCVFDETENKKSIIFALFS